MKTLPEVQLSNMRWLRELILASGKVTTPEQIANLARIENEIARLRELVAWGNNALPS